MLLKFEDCDFSLEGGQNVSSFKYLDVILDQKWNWTIHISNLLQKLGNGLMVFNRILHMLDKRTRLAYSVTIWGDQPGLKSDMQQLPKSVFQEDCRWQFVFSRGPDIVEVASTSWKALWTAMSCCSECNQGRCSRTF